MNPNANPTRNITSSYAGIALTQLVVTTRQGQSKCVAEVALHRPKCRNAMTVDMWQELGAVFEALARDPDVRCIVISGGDGAVTNDNTNSEKRDAQVTRQRSAAFSAGLDLQAAMEMFKPAAEGECPARRRIRLLDDIKRYDDRE